MCRATVDDNHAVGFRPRGGRLDIRAFYLRLSSPAPADLTLVYLPAIGGAALELNGRALPPASPAEVQLRRAGPAGDAAYASADRVCAAEGPRFEVYAGKEMAEVGARKLLVLHERQLQEDAKNSKIQEPVQIIVQIPREQEELV